MSHEGIKVWKNGKFIANDWNHCENYADTGNLILPLAPYLELSQEDREHNCARLAVMLMPEDPLDKIIPFLNILPLIALSFPKYSDGRSHSKAALLKSRYHYEGEIRGTGDILVDQIPLMLRNGFDSLEVTNPIAIKRLEQNISTAVDLFYQPATTESHPTNGYSWRRVPSA